MTSLSSCRFPGGWCSQLDRGRAVKGDKARRAYSHDRNTRRPLLSSSNGTLGRMKSTMANSDNTGTINSSYNFKLSTDNFFAKRLLYSRNTTISLYFYVWIYGNINFVFLIFTESLCVKGTRVTVER